MGRFFPKSKILLLVVLLVFANIAGAIKFTGIAHALGGTQLTTRSVQLSTSQIGTASGATTSYQVNFKPGSATYTVKGIVVDFCNDIPTVGSTTCTAPPGFTVGASPTITTTGAVGTVTDLGNGGGTWTVTSVNSGRTLKMSNTTGVSINPANASAYAFTITNVTNPTAVGTFFARIITYKQPTGDIASYAAGNEGNTAGDAWDYGSVALSTANVISITARVPEQLQFCVSGAVMTATCTGMTTATIPLGHPAGTGAIVDNSAVDTGSAYTQVSTNAQSGVTIRMRNLNTCTTGAGGLQRTGTVVCDIPAVNAGAATAATITAGTAAFGVNISSVGVGFTAQAPYSTAGQYGMDTTTASQNTTTTYGDSLLTSAGPTANINSTITFAATASATTPAGNYAATIVLVCTAQF
jgi:hypothetical protein